MNSIRQVCVHCVTDITDPEVTFDSNGVCRYCREAEKEIPSYRFSPEQEKENLASLTRLLKSKSSSRYHAIIGLSGGVDSSYVTHLARTMGINPLIVHFDNGWNSQKSVSNIKKMIDSCGFDLETLVINWPEFKDLQRSFFKAGVVDIEMVTDHAIMATLFQLQRKYNIKFVLSGSNYVTEHGMPRAWLWRKQDLTNIRAIQKRFGTMKLRAFPTLGTLKFQLILRFNLGAAYIEPLNLINYSKAKAIEVLSEKYGWEYYGGKHYESVFTKFYQAYVLPTKFGFDKRKPHLSALIRNGEITRKQAFEELAQPLYDPVEFRVDKEYVLKKLGFTEQEFEALMQEKPKSHADYATDEWIHDSWRRYGPPFFRRLFQRSS